MFNLQMDADLMTQGLHGNIIFKFKLNVQNNFYPLYVTSKSLT